MRAVLVSAVVLMLAATSHAEPPSPQRTSATQQPSEPSSAPAKQAKPAGKPEPAAKPAAKPAEPAEKPAEPAAKPAEPSEKPAEPSAKPAQPASSAQSVASKTDALVEPPGFTYNPEGRRDPFLSLVRRGVDPRGASQVMRPGGLAGLSVAEITLRGTVRSREGFVAILQGADQRAYIVRPGDKLFDGMVRTVSQNDVVILEEVNDPLSLEKQREVRKLLRQPEAN
jgi:Tfp pilus assembly protein PilP